MIAPHPDRPHELAYVRDRIDELDDALVAMIRDRVALARAAATSKRARGRPQRDPRREAEVVRRAATRARELGVDDDSIRAVFLRLIDLSHRSVAAAEHAP